MNPKNKNKNKSKSNAQKKPELEVALKADIISESGIMNSENGGSESEETEEIYLSKEEMAALQTKVLSLFTTDTEKTASLEMFIEKALKSGPQRTFNSFAAILIEYPEDEQARQAIASFIPPYKAIYASDIRPNHAFRQHRNVFVDKVNVLIDEVIKDPLFWWQPLDDAHLIYALQPLVELIKNFDPAVHNFTFCHLTTEVKNIV